MEYIEVELEQKLEIIGPKVVHNFGNSASECKILEQSFEWTLHRFSNAGQQQTIKARCKSPAFPVNFGGTIFENVQLIIYPCGDNAVEDREWISLFLYVPELRSKYHSAMRANVVFDIVSPVPKSTKARKELAVVANDDAVANGDQCLGFSKFLKLTYSAGPGYAASQELTYDATGTLKISCTVLTIIDSNIQMLLPRIDVPPMPERLLADMYRTQEMSDVTIIIDNKKLPAHKCILAARSPVFKAMFQTQMKEATDNVVEITDVDYDTFDRFLLFIYVGKIAEGLAEDMLELAEKYDMDDLKATCENQLTCNLTIENATRIFIKADLYNVRGLKDAAVAYMKSHLEEVRKTPGWKMAKDEHPRSLVLAFLE